MAANDSKSLRSAALCAFAACLLAPAPARSSEDARAWILEQRAAAAAGAQDALLAAQRQRLTAAIASAAQARARAQLATAVAATLQAERAGGTQDRAAGLAFATLASQIARRGAAAGRTRELAEAAAAIETASRHAQLAILGAREADLTRIAAPPPPPRPIRPTRAETQPAKTPDPPRSRTARVWPLQADISARFGAAGVDGEPLQGVMLKPRGDGAVAAPTAGVARFAGPFRDYAALLILEADDGYAVVLSGFGELSLREGDRVAAGDRIGRIDAASPHARLYLEVRSGEQAVDPLVWLRTGRAREAQSARLASR